MKERLHNNGFMSIKQLFLLLSFTMCSIMAYSQCPTPTLQGGAEYFCSQTSWANGGISVSQGDVLSSILVDGENLTWYADNGGSQGAVIADPSLEVLVDAAIYYVTQTTGGCESSPLQVQVFDRDCGCGRNLTFEDLDGNPTADGYTFYSQPLSDHKTCGMSLGNAPILPLGTLNSMATGNDAVLVTQGNDPTFPAQVTRTNPNNPNSQAAIRLNRDTTSPAKLTTMQAEYVAGEVFAFNFALVLDNPTGHDYDEQPFFQIRIYDQSGNLFSSRCVVSSPDDCILEGNSGGTLYNEWSCMKLNTLNLQGQKIRVEWTVGDCELSAHPGYVYIDDIFVGNDDESSCDDSSFGYLAINSLDPAGASTQQSCLVAQPAPTQGDCAEGLSAALPFPIEVCGSFDLPNSTGNPANIQDLTLNIIQNNSVVGTVSNPVYDVANSTFCFTVSQSDVNVTPYGTFNIEAQMDFDLDCGSPYTLTVDDRNSVDVCPPAGCPNPLVVCDNTGTGIGTFNLTDATPAIRGQFSTNDVDITYFEDVNDALANNNVIGNPQSFDNTNPTNQTVFARVDWDPTGVTGSDCYYVVELELIVNALPDVSLANDVVICGGAAISQTIVATPANLADLNNITYVWYRNGVQIPFVGSAYTVTQDGQYEITVSNDNCEVTEQIIIERVDYKVDLGDAVIDVCDEDPNYNLDLNATLVNVNSTYPIDSSQATYTWSTGETSANINVTSSGVYSVSVDYKGCTETSSVNVNFTTRPVVSLGDDLTLCSGENNEVVADVSNFGDSSNLDFVWYLNDNIISGQNSGTLSVEQAGTYKVEVSEVGAVDCPGVDELEVSFYENENCVITQGISPGGSVGENDCLDLTFLNDRTGIRSIKLFNRHGRLIFEEANYIDTFCGQDKDGNELPTGTYYYVLELNGEDPIFGSSKKGWIYINRAEN